MIATPPTMSCTHLIKTLFKMLKYNDACRYCIHMKVTGFKAAKNMILAHNLLYHFSLIWAEVDCNFDGKVADSTLLPFKRPEAQLQKERTKIACLGISTKCSYTNMVAAIVIWRPDKWS